MSADRVEQRMEPDGLEGLESLDLFALLTESQAREQEQQLGSPKSKGAKKKESTKAKASNSGAEKPTTTGHVERPESKTTKPTDPRKPKVTEKAEKARPTETQKNVTAKQPKVTEKAEKSKTAATAAATEKAAADRQPTADSQPMETEEAPASETASKAPGDKSDTRHLWRRFTENTGHLARKYDTSRAVGVNLVRATLLVWILAQAAQQNLPSEPEQWSHAVGLIESRAERAQRDANQFHLLHRSPLEGDTIHTRGAAYFMSWGLGELSVPPLYPAPDGSETYPEFVTRVEELGYRPWFFHEVRIGVEGLEYAGPASLLFRSQLASIVDRCLRGQSAFQFSERAGSGEIPTVNPAELARALATCFPGEALEPVFGVLVRLCSLRSPRYTVHRVYLSMLSRVFHPRMRRFAWLLCHVATTLPTETVTWVLFGRGERRWYPWSQVFQRQEIADKCYYEKPVRSAERWTAPDLVVGGAGREPVAAAAYFLPLQQRLEALGYEGPDGPPIPTLENLPEAACPLAEDPTIFLARAYPHPSSAAQPDTEEEADADLASYLPAMTEARVVARGLGSQEPGSVDRSPLARRGAPPRRLTYGPRPKNPRMSCWPGIVLSILMLRQRGWIVLLVFMTISSQAAGSSEGDKQVLLCGATKMGQLYSLPQEFSCPKVPMSIGNISQVEVALYTKQVQPLVYPAHRCFCIRTEICTRMSIVGGEGVLSTSEHPEQVGLDECKRAIDSRVLKNRSLQMVSRGFYGSQIPTNTRSFRYCCQDHCYSILNCFLQVGEVAVQPHSSPPLFSSDLGDVGQCRFSHGYCLTEFEVITWKQSTPKHACRYNKKGTYNATLADNHYLVIDELEGAFVLEQPVNSAGIGAGCLPQKAILTSQGVVVTFVEGPPTELSFMRSSGRPTMPNSTSAEADPVNAKLSYLAWKSYEQETRSFAALWTNYCQLARTLVHTIRQLARIDPTLAIRAYFQREDVVAESRGEVYMVWDCHWLMAETIHWNYEKNGVCYNSIPVTWENGTWFLIPGTRELTKEGHEVPCHGAPTGVYRSQTASGNWEFRTQKGRVPVTELSMHTQSLQRGKPTYFKAPPVFEAEKYMHVTRLEMLTTFLHQTKVTQHQVRALTGFVSEMSFDPDMVRQAVENEGQKLGAFVVHATETVAHGFGHVSGAASGWLTGLLKGPFQTLVNTAVLILVLGLSLLVLYGVYQWWRGRETLPERREIRRIRGARSFFALWQRLRRTGLGWCRRGRRYWASPGVPPPSPQNESVELQELRASLTATIRNPTRQESKVWLEEGKGDDSPRSPRESEIVAAPKDWHPGPLGPQKRRQNLFHDVGPVGLEKEEGVASASPAVTRPVVHMEVNSTRKAYTLIDTGSCKSFVSPKLLEQLQAKGVAITYVRNRPITIVSASNHSIRLYKRVELSFRLFGRTWVHTFYVLDGFSSGNECLLGVDFLDQVGPVVFDIRRKMVWMGANLKPPPFPDCPAAPVPGNDEKCKGGQVNSIALQGNQRLTGGTTTWVTCCVPNFQEEKEVELCVIPWEDKLRRNSLEMETCLVTAKFGMFRLPVTNYSRAPCSLYNGTRVASFQTLWPECEVSSVGAKHQSTRTSTCPTQGTSKNKGPSKSQAGGNKQPEITLEQHEANLRAQAKIGDANTSPEQRKRISDLVVQYSDCFSKTDEDFGSTEVVLHRIRTTDEKPVVGYVKTIPLAKRPVVSKITNSLLKMGVIQESHSPNLSPVVIVKKKDGSDRFCTDFRRLNQKTIPDEFPLPTTEEILASLEGSQCYSSLDLNSGYYQVSIHPEDRHWTSFRTHDGLFEYNKLAMGLTGAVATFQRLMTRVLKGILWKGVFCYLDDILCTGSSFEQHCTLLESVFSRLRQANLKCKLRKCEFLKPHVRYLGHKISAQGIEVCEEKVKSVKEYPRPGCPKALQRFLGLCTYYHRFVPAFAQIAQPLYSLLRKDAKYKWTQEQEKAFQTLKLKLTSSPVLAFPVLDKDRPFLIQCDASKSGIGAICAQKDSQGHERVIGYASRTLTKSERNYPPVQAEALAILYGLQRFKHIVFGHPTVIVQSDHKPLEYVLASFHSSSMLQRWALKIQEFQPILEYKRGIENQNADALSRVMDSKPLEFPAPEATASSPCSVLSQAPLTPDIDLLEIQRKHKFSWAMISFLTRGVWPGTKKLRESIASCSHNYTVLHDYLYYVGAGKQQLFVPPLAVPYVLHSFHSSIFSGHFALLSTLKRIQKCYYWPNMYSQIQAYCVACRPCQMYNPPIPGGREPLVPISASRPWELVSSDIMGPISQQARPFRYILAFTDYFTSYAVAVPLREISSATVAAVFVEKIVLVFGKPEKWLTDKASNFCSELIKSLSKTLGTAKVETVPFHPQGDGKVERWNRTCISTLSKHCKENPSEWAESLPYAVFAYNTSYSSKVGDTPYHALFGTDCHIPIPTGLRGPRSAPFYIDNTDYRHEAMMRLQDLWDSIRSRMASEQEKQKKQYDKKAKPRRFRLGDLVYYRKFVHDKIDARYTGPWRLVSLNAPNAGIVPLHKPNLPAKTVHLNHLKKHEDLSPELNLELPAGITGPGNAPQSTATPATSASKDTGGLRKKRGGAGHSGTTSAPTSAPTPPPAPTPTSAAPTPTPHANANPTLKKTPYNLRPRH